MASGIENVHESVVAKIHDPVPVVFAWDYARDGVRLKMSRSLADDFDPVLDVENSFYPRDERVDSSLPSLNIIVVEAEEAVAVADKLFNEGTKGAISAGTYVVGGGTEHINVLMGIIKPRQKTRPDPQEVIAGGISIGLPWLLDLREQQGPVIGLAYGRGHKLAALAGEAAVDALTNHYQESGQEYRLALPAQMRFIDEYGRQVAKLVHTIFCADEAHTLKPLDREVPKHIEWEV